MYNQRNKDETIMSIIERLFEEYVTSKASKSTEQVTIIYIRSLTKSCHYCDDSTCPY